MIHKSICYKQALVLIIRLYAVIQNSILNGDTVFRLDPYSLDTKLAHADFAAFLVVYHTIINRSWPSERCRH